MKTNCDGQRLDDDAWQTALACLANSDKFSIWEQSKQPKLQHNSTNSSQSPAPQPTRLLSHPLEILTAAAPDDHFWM